VALLALGVTGWTMLQPEPPTLTAVYTATAPFLDGSLDDPAWADAPTLQLVTAGNMLDGFPTTGAAVELKAVYTNTTLTIGVRWPDPTISMQRGGSWLWTGSEWKHLSGSPEAVEAGLARGISEDRIAILWDVNVTDFATRGCAVKCHVTEELKHAPHAIDEARAKCFQCHTEDLSIGYGAYLDNSDEIGDIWHSKAARSLPLLHIGRGAAFLGYLDDKHIVHNPDPANINVPDGGRYGDEGRSSYSHNRNQDKTAPRYIETDPVDYWDAIVLTQSEIDSGEAVEVAGLTPEEISACWAKYQALSEPNASFQAASVPERILRHPLGSRADVLMAARWEGGYWTAEIQRSLITGHRDDVQFSDLGKSYPFDIALFDNTGGEGHAFHVGVPPVLVFSLRP
jgi:hypothetical protein